MYPVRIRFPNVIDGKKDWLTIGCSPFVRLVPIVRIVRDTLLQRCLAVMCDGLIGATEHGVTVNLRQHGRMLAISRVVLYTADQPE